MIIVSTTAWQGYANSLINVQSACYIGVNSSSITEQHDKLMWTA